MKIIATYIKHLFDNKHHAELTFKVANYKHTQMLNELDSDKIYQIEIKERKSKRSLEQNRLLWAMLHELEKVSNEDMMLWYIHALTECGAKFDYVLGTDEIKDNLIGAFRAVRLVGKRMVGDKELNMYKCFYGSSKMNVSEMNKLIDIVLRYCAEYDIDTDLLKY